MIATGLQQDCNKLAVKLQQDCRSCKDIGAGLHLCCRRIAWICRDIAAGLQAFAEMLQQDYSRIAGVCRDIAAGLQQDRRDIAAGLQQVCGGNCSKMLQEDCNMIVARCSRIAT